MTYPKHFDEDTVRLVIIPFHLGRKQDGPSDHSSVNSVKPLGEGWYRVDYADLGNPGQTDVQVSGGKICAYRSMNEN